MRSLHAQNRTPNSFTPNTVSASRNSCIPAPSAATPTPCGASLDRLGANCYPTSLNSTPPPPPLLRILEMTRFCLLSDASMGKVHEKPRIFITVFPWACLGYLLGGVSGPPYHRRVWGVWNSPKSRGGPRGLLRKFFEILTLFGRILRLP